MRFRVSVSVAVVVMVTFGIIYHKSKCITGIQNRNNTAYGAGKLVKYGGSVYAFPVDMAAILPWRKPSGENHQLITESQYFRYVQTIEVECQYRRRIGHMEDGGWDLCLAGIYRPNINDCLVLSFGIKDDWSFDNKMASEYGCTVHSFDPSIGLVEHRTASGVDFHPLGLYSVDNYTAPDSSVVLGHTLATLIQTAGVHGTIIDYLKFDIEWYEWSVLPQLLTSGLLSKHVKQLAFEAHTGVKVHSYSVYLQTLDMLNTAGFRRWRYHLNPKQMYTSTYAKERIYSACQELYYVNLNFIER